MATSIRLARAGTKKKPFFHIVVCDQKYKRDGRYLARIGTHNPKGKEGERTTLNQEALDAWLKKGVIVSETVGHLLKAAAKSTK